MSARIIIILLASLLTMACVAEKKPDVDVTQEQEESRDVLYILADGTKMFKGRVMNDEDVVIYDAKQHGERAAIKIMMPLHPDAYRDNITVERTEIDVPVERK
jgi:hypothetical protein